MLQQSFFVCYNCCMGKYIVTGGFGLIGSEIVNNLIGDISIISRSEKNKKRVKKSDIKIIIKSLSQIEKSDLQGADIIYHCASTVDNYNVLTDPYIDVNTNINGTVRILEICKDLEKKPKIIFLSTFFVYGNVYEKTKQPVNELTITDPLAIYPATKLCVESIIRLYKRLYDIPYLICRLTNVFGEHENFDNKKKGALNYLIMKAIKNEDINVYKSGNFYRDYVYVDDVVSALLFLEQQAENDIFLIGFGTPVRFKDLMDYIIVESGSQSKVTQIEPPEFHKAVGITDFVADISKIQNLGWRAKIDYKEGVRRIIKEYRS